ncbi:outer membrane protein assembly factor BamE [Pigmentiphaga soli]|uniref:outer membrane protein assembly factor BamE n=1 Tax=Pigmentiphaga soli TaxID=1007095 RepID=UPI0031EA00CA
MPTFIRPYRPDVQQGNWITQSQVDLLRPGMTREQVRFALGSPTLTDIFHADRWDYPYLFKGGKSGVTEERKFSVYFADDRLVRWEGDPQPARQPFQTTDTIKTMPPAPAAAVPAAPQASQPPQASGPDSQSAPGQAGAPDAQAAPDQTGAPASQAAPGQPGGAAPQGQAAPPAPGAVISPPLIPDRNRPPTTDGTPAPAALDPSAQPSATPKE